MTAFDIGRDHAADTQEITKLLRAAVPKYAAGDDWNGEGIVEIVVERFGDAHGRGLITRVASDMMCDQVDSAWQRGWQPVDLDRLVGRSLKQPERTLLGDAMADHLSQYAASTVDPEWHGQLRDLGASVWWRSNQGWLAARADQEGWYAALTLLMRLLGALWLIPPIEKLGPAPGEQHHRASATPDVEPKVLERVRRLLAKAESTTFEAEAETFTAGAQSLMARHSIDAALLAASEHTVDGPGMRRIGVGNPYEAPKVSLLNGIAAANRARAIWSKDLGFVTVIGHHEDLDAVETLFTSLLVQATSTMTRQGSRKDLAGRSRTAAFRRSFLTAFAVRISERLQEAADAEVSRAADEVEGHG